MQIDTSRPLMLILCVYVVGGGTWGDRLLLYDWQNSNPVISEKVWNTAKSI